MAISQGGQGKGALFTEINITPLTDIFLVLLIVMMVIAPMFQNTNKEITVPGIKSGQSVEDNQVVVEITKAGSLFVNGTQALPNALEGQLRSMGTNLKEKHLIVRADQATPSSQVLKIYEAASQAGFEKLTIAGEPLSAARQGELNAGNASQPPSPVEATP